MPEGAEKKHRRIGLIIFVLFVTILLLFVWSKWENISRLVNSESDRASRLQALGRKDRVAHKADDQPGHWFYARSDIKKRLEEERGSLTAEQRRQMDQLEGIGYLAGHHTENTQKNVTIYDREKAYRGLNLYVSGHGTEAILMDMDGKVLHKWQLHIEQALPDFKPKNPKHYAHRYWRRVHLFENGDLLVIFEGLALVKIDKNSNLLWVYDGGAHHDLEVAEDGRIYVLTRHAVLNPRYNAKEPILEDFICILSPTGQEQQCVSVLESIENSRFSNHLQRLRKKGDVFHTNTIELLDGRLAEQSPAFQKGNVLISIRNLDLVAVVNLERKEAVWAKYGLWRKQHQPTILENGHLLIFDNGTELRAKSKVLELDPLSEEIYWVYMGSRDNPFYSPTIGSAARLPNGNTLITESTAGRAFEVTPDKTIVWEFISPHRLGENDEMIATLFEMIRLPQSFPMAWL